MCLTLEYTRVKAGPNLACSPRKVMVSDCESGGGISTDTPVSAKISWIVCPRGPIMYLCWFLLTSTETTWQFLF